MTFEFVKNLTHYDSTKVTAQLRDFFSTKMQNKNKNSNNNKKQTNPGLQATFVVIYCGLCILNIKTFIFTV